MAALRLKPPRLLETWRPRMWPTKASAEDAPTPPLFAANKSAEPQLRNGRLSKRDDQTRAPCMPIPHSKRTARCRASRQRSVATAPRRGAKGRNCRAKDAPAGTLRD
eukprot:13776659-Alexandrium_andersonii.AAC.1